MTRRSKADRLAAAHSTRASRAPARPASATATAASIAASSGVRRAYRLVRPSTCSANVAAGPPGASQKNRRTASRITAFRPPIATSASRR
jgi:hypothetical protein